MSELELNNKAIGRTPNLIAAEINNIKEQTRRMVLYNSIEIGRRLIEAKEMLPHGEWGNWLKESVDYSQRTANNLMRIFQEYGADQITLLGDNSKSQAFANLSYSQAIALLEIPEEEREDFIEENDVEDMSTRELQKVIKERDDARKCANEKAREAKKLLDEKLKAESELRTTDKLFRDTQKKFNSIEDALRKEKEKSEERLLNLNKTITENKELLSKAKKTGNNEEIEKLQALITTANNELLEANNKIAELEKQLKEKPIEVVASPEVIEKIPEKIEKELQELREKVKQPQDNENLIKFKVHFDKTVLSVKDMLGVLVEIKEVNEDEYQKYRKAAVGLLNKMLEKI